KARRRPEAGRSSGQSTGRAKIGAHPVGRRERRSIGLSLRGRPVADAEGSRLVLKLIRKNVRVSLLAIVEKAARRGKKLERPDRGRAQREGPLALGAHPAP